MPDSGWRDPGPPASHRHPGIGQFPFDVAGQFCRQWMGGEIAERGPKGCPETDAFRDCVLEGVREQADAEDDHFWIGQGI